MKKWAFLLVFSLLLVGAYGQSVTNEVINTILNGYSARAYTSEPVSDKDIELILDCGVKAPSARNAQPWKFTVIKNGDLVGQIIRNATPGNVVILISGPESAEQGMSVNIDCALATESMFIAALGLGLGARIYTAPIAGVNARKQDFQIPEGYRAVTALRIGHMDKNVDAVTAASPRKAKAELVNVVE